MRTRWGKVHLLGAVVLAGVAAMLPACGADSDGPIGGGEQGIEACRDGADNDSDGLVDCRDPGCQALAICVLGDGGLPSNVEVTTAACQDGRDNDGDNLVDCADPDCKDLLVCNAKPPAACDCNDNLACTADACDATSGACSHAVNAGSCVIANKCYANGEKNGAACEVCDATGNKTGWTAIVGGCTIGGLCYRKGERSTDGCSTCDPARSVTTWSPVVAAKCTVGGRCYLDGERDPTGCDMCVPAQSTTVLQDAPYACQIGGQCFVEGAKHPSATCRTAKCSSAVSPAIWSILGDECLIGGECYLEGAKSPDGCGTCIPSQSKTAWTPQAFGCKIGGVCFAQGQKYPNASCTSVVCDAGTSTTSWTIAGNECLIGGICRQAGDRTSNGCLECNPAVSKAAFSAVTGGCNIGGQCYSNAAPHPSATCTSVTCNAAASTTAWTIGDQCLIGGVCYAAGAKAPGNCQECNPALSKTGWSAAPTSCTIGGACYVNGGAHPSATCNPYAVTCNAAQSTTAWSVAGDGCFIGTQCYANGTFDGTGCSKCDTSVSKTAWTPQASCTNILMAALNNGYQGNLGGIAGANALCTAQAAAAGYNGTWKAFLSSSTQNVKDLITGTNATIPVVNLLGQNMYASWNAVFTQASWNTTAAYIHAFNGAWVDEGRATPDWYDADGWHGSTATGLVSPSGTCSDWVSTSGNGANGEWDFRNMFTSEADSCSQYLAVACIRLPQ